MPPRGQRCHHAGRHATRRADMPPRGRTATRRAEMPPRGQTCHQTGRHATRRAEMPPDGQRCHQTGRDATRRAETPPDGQTRHQTGGDATTRAETPPDGRTATTRAEMPPDGQECHQTGGDATRRAGMPPRGRTSLPMPCRCLADLCRCPEKGRRVAKWVAFYPLPPDHQARGFLHAERYARPNVLKSGLFNPLSPLITPTRENTAAALPCPPPFFGRRREKWKKYKKLHQPRKKLAIFNALR